MTDESPEKNPAQRAAEAKRARTAGEEPVRAPFLAPSWAQMRQVEHRIFAAVRKGDVAAAELLVEADPDAAHARGYREETALHAAAAAGIVRSVSLLLAHGADPRAVSKGPGDRPWTAAEAAHATGQYATMALVLRAGCPPFDPLDATSLERIERVSAMVSERDASLLDRGLVGLMDRGKWDLVLLLAEAGISIECDFTVPLQRGIRSRLPRHHFAWRALVEAPVSALAKIARVIRDPDRALHEIAKAQLRGPGRARVLKILLERGADANAARDGFTPLTRALAWDEVEAFDALLQAGARLEESSDRFSPAHQAAAAGSIAGLAWLHAHGVPLTSTSELDDAKRGCATALETAARSGHVEAVSWFAQTGLATAEDVRPLLAVAALARDAYVPTVPTVERWKHTALSAKKAGAKPAKPKALRVPKAIAAALERLGIALAPKPHVDPRALNLAAGAHWLAHVVPPRGAFMREPRPGRTEPVRGLRLCIPWLAPSGLASGSVVVFGQTPGHCLAIENAHAINDPNVQLIPAPGVDPSRHPDAGKLASFFAGLVPDPDYALAREVPASERASFSPHLEAHVLWALHATGVGDVGARTVPLSELGRLAILRIRGSFDLRELDGRFASLAHLQISSARLPDLTPLRGMSALRGLMLDACALMKPEQLASLTQLDELHLPSCALRDVSFVRALPRLRSVTVCGNALSSGSKDLLASLPGGLEPSGRSDEELAIADQLASIGISSGPVFLRPRRFVFPVRVGDAIHWAEGPVGNVPAEAAVAALRAAAAAPRAHRPLDYPSALREWPETGLTNPVTRDLASNEVVEQLARLRVILDPSLPEGFRTATTRLLARARWPRGVTYRIHLETKDWLRGTGEVSLKGFSPVPLMRDFVHDVGVVHPLFWGNADGGNTMVLVTKDDEMDPSVYFWDHDERSPRNETVRLSRFLAGLRAEK